MELRRLRAVLFDLDGTLCRYTVGVADAILGAIRRLHLPEDALGDLQAAAGRYTSLWRDHEGTQDALGRVRATVWQHLLAEHPQVDPALASPLAEAYGEIRTPSVRLYPGARELLVGLRRRFRLGLLTNGPSEMQWSKIRGNQIESLFDAIAVAGDTGIYKPDPRAFAMLLERLRVAADDAVYVGDSLAMDVAGARAAALRSVWISRNGETPATDPALTPDHTIHDLEALRKVLL